MKKFIFVCAALLLHPTKAFSSYRRYLNSEAEQAARLNQSKRDIKQLAVLSQNIEEQTPLDISTALKNIEHSIDLVENPALRSQVNKKVVTIDSYLKNLEIEKLKELATEQEKVDGNPIVGAGLVFNEKKFVTGLTKNIQQASTKYRKIRSSRELCWKLFFKTRTQKK